MGAASTTFARTSKRTKFVRLTEARVAKTIKCVRLIGNLANRSTYKFTDNDVKQIFGTLEKELKSARERFQSSNGDASSIVFKLKE